jgi:hypothetical protein
MRRCLLISIKSVALIATLALTNCVVAQEPFPNINDAEGHLSAALQSLHQAPPRFGGHKEEAIRLIQQAISELEIAKQAFH